MKFSEASQGKFEAPDQVMQVIDRHFAREGVCEFEGSDSVESISERFLVFTETGDRMSLALAMGILSPVSVNSFVGALASGSEPPPCQGVFVMEAIHCPYQYWLEMRWLPQRWWCVYQKMGS